MIIMVHMHVCCFRATCRFPWKSQIFLHITQERLWTSEEPLVENPLAQMQKSILYMNWMGRNCYQRLQMYKIKDGSGLLSSILLIDIIDFFLFVWLQKEMYRCYLLFFCLFFCCLLLIAHNCFQYTVLPVTTYCLSLRLLHSYM